MQTKYRVVQDQANIGVEPLNADTAKISNGTYHGRVHLVQSCGPDVGDGWTFVAAFYNSHNADVFCDRLNIQHDILDA